MFFTAGAVTAQDAYKWGILNHLVPAPELEKFTYELAQRMSSKAPLVLASVKEQLRLLAQAAPLTPDVFERIQELRGHVYQSEDYREGLRAFYDKRKPVFMGK
jgi:methylmalonyl-CoA decarboxylase